MADSMTPEERLFKAAAAGALATAGAGGPAMPSGPGGAMGRGGAEPWIQWLKKLASAQPIRRANQGLVLLLVLLTGYLIYDVIVTPKRLARELTAGRPARSDAPELFTEASSQASLDQFLETVRRRDVFHPPGTKAGSSPMGGGAAAPPPVSLTEGLRLVGIAWGAKPEAMIDDQKVKQTYFLTEGQHVRTLTVEKITQDHVILKADSGERVTL